MSNYVDNSAEVIDSDICGKSVNVYKFANIRKSSLKSFVSIGDYAIVRHSILEDKIEIGRRNTIDHVVIGKGTYTGEFCIIKYCTIGKFCSISWNVSIGGANHHINKLSTAPTHRILDDEYEKYASFENEKINIGSDVWIAAGAHILRGVQIGNGAVIGANSVVTKDVHPYAIVAGVPAKIIGYRFEPEIINALQEIKWWDQPEIKLQRLKPFFKRELNSQIVQEIKRIIEEV